jgi:chromosomal replication initiator protein
LETGISTNTWERVLGKLQSKVSTHSFSTWFKPTRFLSEDASSISVRVPNSWFAEWLKTNYAGLIQDALRELHRPGLSIDFRPDAQVGAATPADADPAPARGRSSGSRLNPKYSFNSFVVSSCNQFAHAASIAVAEQPSCAYNPLYVYGGVGLGKTHLMQAIGNQRSASRRRSSSSSATATWTSC